jgi:hypothetical protein
LIYLRFCGIIYFMTIENLRRSTRALTYGVLLTLGASGCAAALNSDSDAADKLKGLGYTNVEVGDEDAVFAEQYCADGFGTSFEFTGERAGYLEVGRLCIPEVGEIFKKPYVIAEERTPLEG